jgi:glycosyltransferase involved in cell wall biosynthesis
MEYVFWLAVFGCLYSYLFYPILLKLFPARLQRPGNGQVAYPLVTILIAAHNENARIEKKLLNTLSIDYPRERLEIIVASDASTDATDSMVERYGAQGVTLVRSTERKGKEHAQSLAIQASSGDIIVFTDSGTEIPTDCLHELVRSFSDPSIGAVSSEDRFVSREGKLVGEGAYVKYEMWLRKLESQRAGLVGLSGSFFAARRQVCATWDTQTPSDFNTAISCARMGMVAVTDPNVVGYYADIKDESKEYQRKLRTVLRGIVGLARHAGILNVRRYGLFAFQIWSHKVMRWLVPWFMLTALISSLSLWPLHGVYRLAVVAQVGVYVGIAAAYLYPGLRRNLAVRIAYYFVQVNLAIAHATILFLIGRRMTVWQPSQR